MSSESRPIRIEEFILALEDLTNENIESVLLQLRNLIGKLKETNAYLAEEIKADSDPDSRSLYEETIAENKQVMESQEARVAAIQKELQRRGAQREQQEDGIYL